MEEYGKSPYLERVLASIAFNKGFRSSLAPFPSRSDRFPSLKTNVAIVFLSEPANAASGLVSPSLPALGNVTSLCDNGEYVTLPQITSVDSGILSLSSLPSRGRTCPSPDTRLDRASGSQRAMCTRRLRLLASFFAVGFLVVSNVVLHDSAVHLTKSVFKPRWRIDGMLHVCIKLSNYTGHSAPPEASDNGLTQAGEGIYPGSCQGEKSGGREPGCMGSWGDSTAGRSQ
eukprot:528806-Amorphochlora_amoeboformis.AAC.1